LGKKTGPGRRKKQVPRSHYIRGSKRRPRSREKDENVRKILGGTEGEQAGSRKSDCPNQSKQKGEGPHTKQGRISQKKKESQSEANWSGEIQGLRRGKQYALLITIQG